MATMGTFLEDLGKIIGEKAEKVSNKAGEAMEIQKLKNQVRELERGCKSDLVELGRMVYASYQDGAEIGEDAAAVCEAIRDREESIAEYKEKISVMKGNSKCEICGKTISKDMSYCPYCGAKKPEDAEEEMEAFVEDAEDFIDEAADKVEDFVETAAEKAEDAVETVEEKIEGSAE